MTAKIYVWIFARLLGTRIESVQEVYDISQGKFGNLDAPPCESMPMAATEVHNGQWMGIKLRLDYAQQWYQLQARGLTQTFEIDTTRPLMKDVLAEDGTVIGQIVNRDPYHYATVPVLDIDGNPTGAMEDKFMEGPGL